MFKKIELFVIITIALQKGGFYMAKKGENRERITLKCTVCGEKNYRTPKNKRNTPERMELSKYCSRCGQHTVHKEEK